MTLNEPDEEARSSKLRNRVFSSLLFDTCVASIRFCEFSTKLSNILSISLFAFIPIILAPPPCGMDGKLKPLQIPHSFFLLSLLVQFSLTLRRGCLSQSQP